MRKIDFLSGFFALMSKVEWSSFYHLISSESSLSAIKLTIWSSATSALISVLLGIPLAWYLARGNAKVTNILRPLVLAPIVLPPTVSGMALLALFGRNGLLGRHIFELTNWSMPFTTVAVVITGVFVGLPFFALVVESSFRNLSSEIEDAAKNSGASNFQLLRDVAIPIAKSGIAVGAILAWARALGEFGATMMFAGSLPGSTQTWAMQVYLDMDVNQSAAYALSSVMVIIAIIVVFLTRKQLRAAFLR